MFFFFFFFWLGRIGKVINFVHTIFLSILLMVPKEAILCSWVQVYRLGIVKENKSF